MLSFIVSRAREAWGGLSGPVKPKGREPITASEAGRMGAATAYSNYRERVRAKADQLRSEVQASKARSAG